MKLFGNGNRSGGRRGSSERPREIRRPVKNEFEFDDTTGLDEHYSADGAEDEDIELIVAQYKRKKSRRRRTAFGIVCLVAVAVVIAYNVWVQPPDLNTDGIGTAAAASPSPEPAPTGTAAPTTPEPTATINPNETRNENAYTFVVVGGDAESGNTDTILVGKFDTRNHTLNVVSIPRDTLANVNKTYKGETQTVKKVNTIFRDTGGTERVYEDDGFLEGVKNLLGFGVDCWAYVDLEAFEKLVDTIGGVDYDVPIDMVYEDYVQDLYINIPAGMQHLNGKQALQVMRFRSGYLNADLGRIETQQDFLMSVAKQMLTLGNIPKIGEIANIFVEYVDTNLNARNITYFAQEFLKLSADDITFQTLPYTVPANGTIRGGSYLVIDLDAWLDMINEYINPHYQQITQEDVDILLWNDSAQSATSTQGDTYSLHDFYDFNNIY